jgi:chloramphenicol 3-O phosphotransferase
MTGKLIVLNGGSSAGKSSIALEFQEIASEPWMHLGIDVFWCAIPQSQLDLQRVRPEYYTSAVTVGADGLEYLDVTPGPLLNKAMHARYLAIRAFLDEGINVIADDMFWTREWIADCLRTFEGYEVWLVGIHVSDEEGARRESERLGRVTGSSRGSARAAHADAEYDIELDTTDVAVRSLAQELHEKYQALNSPKAFHCMSKRLLAPDTHQSADPDREVAAGRKFR